MIIIIIILVILFILVINELSNFSLDGGFVSEQITEVYMNKLDTRQLKCIGGWLFSNLPATISENLFFSFFSKYHIDGFGRIPRWSKIHERVEIYYAIAFMNNL